jgi:hypothetical protein
VKDKGDDGSIGGLSWLNLGLLRLG